MKPGLKRPADHVLQRFRPEDAGRDTVATYVEQGYSLVICCRACPRMVEWTPPDLERRFAGTPEVRISHLAQRLACTSEGGCGSKDIAVFPQLFAGEWTPPSRR